jgi:hypothetical protein
MAQVYIVVCGRSSVDEDTAEYAIPCLDIEVRVVPGKLRDQSLALHDYITHVQPGTVRC